jgi:phospholipid/cholesterol/gamma-HCH transport system ATP-binding protein
MQTPAIRAQDLTIQFDAEPLLRSIQLSVNEGEIFVIIGPSGHGKSVLLKALAGILRPQQGRVEIHGESLYEMPELERARVMRKMGMLFQKNALFDSLTVAENIAFPMREVTSLPESEIQLKVDFFLEAVGISHARDLHPHEISGGMQKRLGIARALALDPREIFYDDPTAGLDPSTSRKIIQLIIDMQKKNRSTAIAITNDMARAYQMADRIGMVVDGDFIVTGTVQETKAHSDPRVHQFITGELNGPLMVIT